MLQINHRESFDVDIFIDDPQVLPYLNPQTQSFSLDINPDAYTTDGTHALKIVFKDLREIDFIVATHLTSDPTKEREIRGQKVCLETPAEIVAKKLFYRGASMQPRDMFDIACVCESEGHEPRRGACSVQGYLRTSPDSGTQDGCAARGVSYVQTSVQFKIFEGSIASAEDNDRDFRERLRP